VKISKDVGKRYQGAQQQQRQVQLDSDWNQEGITSKRFRGIYRGLVVDNSDPESLMRLRVKAPDVLGDNKAWALPCIPVGAVVVPGIGAGLWIMFEGGDPRFPVWIGT
jgi:hypothetical protein